MGAIRDGRRCEGSSGCALHRPARLPLEPQGPPDIREAMREHVGPQIASMIEQGMEVIRSHLLGVGASASPS